MSRAAIIGFLAAMALPGVAVADTPAEQATEHDVPLKLRLRGDDPPSEARLVSGTGNVMGLPILSLRIELLGSSGGHVIRVTPEDGDTGWVAAGFLGGLFAGVPIVAAASLARASPAVTATAALGGAAAGIVGGYLLGDAARRGSLAAKTGVVVLDVIVAIPLVYIAFPLRSSGSGPSVPSRVGV